MPDEESDNKKGKKSKVIEDLFIAPQIFEQYGIYDDYSELVDGVFYYQDQQIERMLSLRNVCS